MATYQWGIPAGKAITGTTLINQADNNLSDTVNDLVDFVNGEGAHLGQGLSYDLVTLNTNQTVSGFKTFSEVITGNVSGNVTGSLIGNASTATTLQTARNISLTGDVTGTVSFDGANDISIGTTILNGSHSHTVGDITDYITDVDNRIKTTYSTSTTGGGIKTRLSGNTLFITTDGTDA